MTDDNPLLIYTIGHSNHSEDSFFALLRMHEIGTLIDVRTRPRSRFRQFNQRNLASSVGNLGMGYLYMGSELGGHPEQEELYDTTGHLVYERIAYTKDFREGIQRLEGLAATRKLALMCAEGDPMKCHRHPLLARSLIEKGVQVLHIRRDGSLVDASQVQLRDKDAQLPLLETVGEDFDWRSPKRIK